MLFQVLHYYPKQEKLNLSKSKSNLNFVVSSVKKKTLNTTAAFKFTIEGKEGRGSLCDPLKIK